jgi:hypothetical protein
MEDALESFLHYPHPTARAYLRRPYPLVTGSLSPEQQIARDHTLRDRSRGDSESLAMAHLSLPVPMVLQSDFRPAKCSLNFDRDRGKTPRRKQQSLKPNLIVTSALPGFRCW